jgi:hypothetical protein
MQMGGFFFAQKRLKQPIFLKNREKFPAIYLGKSQSKRTFAIQFTVFELWVFGSRGYIGPTLNQKNITKWLKKSLATLSCK